MQEVDQDPVDRFPTPRHVQASHCQYARSLNCDPASRTWCCLISTLHDSHGSQESAEVHNKTRHLHTLVPCVLHTSTLTVHDRSGRTSTSTVQLRVAGVGKQSPSASRTLRLAVIASGSLHRVGHRPECTSESACTMVSSPVE